MFTNHNHRKYLTSIAAALVIAFISAGVASAAFISINTNDGLDDSNWPGTPTITDPTGDASSNYDIQSFWVATNAATPGNFYFRATLVGTIPNNSFLEARLDCDNNGDFFGTVDVLVEYLRDNDGVYVYNGDISASDTESLSTKGEKTSTNAYEWGSPTTGGNVDWTACRTASTISVMLATVDGSLNDIDVTGSRGYDVPTVVTLQRFGASTDYNRVVVALVGILSLIVVACGYYIWHRRTQNLSDFTTQSDLS